MGLRVGKDLVFGLALEDRRDDGIEEERMIVFD